MLPELTKGALDRIVAGEEVEEPIFQLLGYRRLVSSTGDERYTLRLPLRRVMVFLNIDLLVAGHEVGKVLYADEARAEEAGSDAPRQANAGPPTQSSDEPDAGGTKDIV